ncbi:MAG: hypothetical protein ACU0CI_01520 [Shimia sp.]
MQHRATQRELAKVRAFAFRTGRFTKSELTKAIAITNQRAGNALMILRDEGLLTLIRQERGHYLYQLQDYEELSSLDRARLATKEGVIWTQIRGLRVFTARDVYARLIGSPFQPTHQDVAQYCAKMVEGGLLSVIDKGSRSRDRKYRLTRNVGPLPPLLRRVPLIYDPNTCGLLGLEVLE